MWLKIAAIAALCVTDAFAQPPTPPIRNQGCMTTGRGMLPFQFCVEVPMLMPPTTLYWNASVNGAIEFAYEAPSGAWRAVGFSDVPAMGPSNVVVGCVPQMLSPMEADFMLPTSPAERQPTPGAGNQNLEAYEQTIANDLCTVTFRRPVNITIPTQLLNDRMQMVVAARGQGEAIMAHAAGGANRIVFGVNFANPNVPDPDMPTTGTMPPGGTNAPGADNGASTLGASITLLSVTVGTIYAALW